MIRNAGSSDAPLKETTNVAKPLGLAQKQLCLKSGRKKTSDPVYRPLPQVTKTSLYDEHWAAKQERGTVCQYCTCAGYVSM